MTAVRLERVTRLFDGSAAVTALTLTVGNGEVLLVEGANGSGKSTLLRIVATALSPTFGTGTVLGADLVRHRSWIRARLELVGHEPRSYADLTAAENLRFVCALYGASTDRVGAALERVGLEDVARVRVSGFSQGMRQRLAQSGPRPRPPPGPAAARRAVRRPRPGGARTRRRPRRGRTALGPDGAPRQPRTTSSRSRRPHGSDERRADRARRGRSVAIRSFEQLTA